MPFVAGISLAVVCSWKVPIKFHKIIAASWLDLGICLATQYSLQFQNEAFITIRFFQQVLYWPFSNFCT
jgi:hypothetical protein